jgi:hypothetical protein
MRQIFEDDVFKLWLSTFEQDDNPMNQVAPTDITPHGAYIMLGEQTGWRQCLTRFVLGGVPIETPKPVGTQDDQTYADPLAEEAEQ